jgi:hypothetical protein
LKKKSLHPLGLPALSISKFKSKAASEYLGEIELLYEIEISTQERKTYRHL